MRFKTETLDGTKEHRFIARLVDPMIWYIPDTKIREIRKWCDDQRIPCSQVQSQFFFKNEDDRFHFLLRWHQ